MDLVTQVGAYACGLAGGNLSMLLSIFTLLLFYLLLENDGLYHLSVVSLPHSYAVAVCCVICWL